MQKFKQREDNAPQEKTKELVLPKRKKYRKVKLKFHEDCECGTPPYDVDVIRTVPEDSPLQDGDYITEFESNDIFIM